MIWICSHEQLCWQGLAWFCRNWRCWNGIWHASFLLLRAPCYLRALISLLAIWRTKNSAHQRLFSPDFCDRNTAFILCLGYFHSAALDLIKTAENITALPALPAKMRVNFRIEEVLQQRDYQRLIVKAIAADLPEQQFISIGHCRQRRVRVKFGGRIKTAPTVGAL